ncbi:MAG: hypothetical protein E5Y50_08225 [Mesorhizobium sp.]|nr:MAG: hypothetical protein E5Y50_08225 [Mesorhizobium sp.]
MLIQASESKRFTSCPAFCAISRSAWAGEIHDLLDGNSRESRPGRIIITIGVTPRGDGGIRFAHERSRC